MTLSQRTVEAAANAIRIMRNGSREGQAKLALESALAVDGLCLVPKEPTDKMLKAGFKKLGWTKNTENARSDAMEVYRAMIAAASDGEDSPPAGTEG